MFSNDEMHRFIKYFKDDQEEFYKWIEPKNREDGWGMGYYDYSEGVNEFITAFYEADLGDKDYIKNLENHNQPYGEIIENADAELLKSILTFYVRGERFCEGTWAGAIDEKIFLNILIRLNELLK